jgi:hypothetical protein
MMWVTDDSSSVSQVPCQVPRWSPAHQKQIKTLGSLPNQVWTEFAVQPQECLMLMCSDLAEKISTDISNDDKNASV